MKIQKTKLGTLEMQLLSYAQLRKKDVLSPVSYTHLTLPTILRV